MIATAGSRVLAGSVQLVACRYQREQAEIDEQQARLRQQRVQTGADEARQAQVDRDYGELVPVTRPVDSSSGDETGAP